jgi:hypothetical protein
MERAEAHLAAGALPAARADVTEAAALFDAQGAVPAARQARAALAAMQGGAA